MHNVHHLDTCSMKYMKVELTNNTTRHSRTWHFQHAVTGYELISLEQHLYYLEQELNVILYFPSKQGKVVMEGGVILISCSLDK